MAGQRTDVTEYEATASTIYTSEIKIGQNKRCYDGAKYQFDIVLNNPLPQNGMIRIEHQLS